MVCPVLVSPFETRVGVFVGDHRLPVTPRHFPDPGGTTAKFYTFDTGSLAPTPVTGGSVALGNLKMVKPGAPIGLPPLLLVPSIVERP